MGKRRENKTIGDMADEAFVLDSEPVIVISGLQSSPQESNSIEKTAKIVKARVEIKKREEN